MKTLADIKRAMTVGSKWECFNHLYNTDMGTRPVSKKSSDHVTFETVRNDGEIVHSRFDFPKASQVRFSEDGLAFTVSYDKDGVSKDKLSYRMVT